MKLFQNIFNKNHELNEEQQQRFNSMVENDSSQSQQPTSLQQNPHNLVASLQSLEEINKIRNLLDKREKELETGSMYLVESEIKHQEEPEFEAISVNSNSVSEENIEESITENDLNYETYEDSEPFQESEKNKKEESTNYSDNLNSYEETSLSSESPELTFGNNDNITTKIPQEESYEALDKEEEINPMPEELLEKKEEEHSKGIEIDLEPDKDSDFIEFDSLNTKKTVEEDILSPEMDLYCEKIKTIFGEENFFARIEEENKTSYNSNKKLLHIGIRQKENFGQGNTLEENAWFIGHIKQLEDLKSYKMLRSEQGMKDLVKEDPSFVTIISFRGTSFLNSLEEFDFEL